MKLFRKPFAITGNICIGRGITINSEKFMITHMVFPPSLARTPEVASQIAGRGCGYFKHWKKLHSSTNILHFEIQKDNY